MNLEVNVMGSIVIFSIFLLTYVWSTNQRLGEINHSRRIEPKNRGGLSSLTGRA